MSSYMSLSEFFRDNALYGDPFWKSIFHEILHSGVRLTEAKKVKWLAGYTNVPLTKKSNPVKAHFYLMHDLFHQLFPVECTGQYEEEDRIKFKKSSMVGEVAVLYITEFLYAECLTVRVPEWKEEIEKRKSLPLLRFLREKGFSDMMDVLDNLIYEEEFYEKLRGSEEVGRWIDHYWGMLEKDRNFLDFNWDILKKNQWEPWKKFSYPENLNHKTLGNYFLNKFYEIGRKGQDYDPQRRWANSYKRLRSLPNFKFWAG